jgi:hypothetical protein
VVDGHQLVVSGVDRHRITRVTVRAVG